MPRSVVTLLENPSSRKLVGAMCEENGVFLEVFEELVQAEAEQVGKQRKAGLWDSFDDILDRIQTGE